MNIAESTLDDVNFEIIHLQSTVISQQTASALSTSTFLQGTYPLPTLHSLDKKVSTQQNSTWIVPSAVRFTVRINLFATFHSLLEKLEFQFGLGVFLCTYTASQKPDPYDQYDITSPI